MRARRAWGVAAAALLCSLGAPLAPAAGAAGPVWTAEPASGPGVGRPYVYLEGVPGTVLEDKLSLTNPGTGPLTVRLSAGPSGTGPWTRFTQVTVRVPPRTRALVPFSVTVPRNTAPGDHAGALVATADGREAAVRIHLRVSGAPLPALTVEDVRLASGRIHYALVNRGNTVLVPRLAVHADGLLGTALDRPARSLALELRPGARAELTEPWPGTPALDAVTVRLTVTAPGAARAEGGDQALFLSWTRIATASAGAAALAAALTVWRIRRPGRRAMPEVPKSPKSKGTW